MALATRPWLLPALLVPVSLLAADRPACPPEPIVGGRCEGCEAVFQGMPDRIPSIARIAPADEPGEPMRIEGTVTDAAGGPVAGVVVYAYHTDAQGIYPRPERPRGEAADRHGRLRGWARTDERGRYRFDTIRPASYPDQRIPAHVHMHVIEVGCCTYYIASVHFDDDPLLSPEQRERFREGRGGSGLTHPVKGPDGAWFVTRNIVLGEGVPGYPGCDRRDAGAALECTRERGRQN